MSSLIFTGNIFWDWVRSFLSWIDVVFYTAISWFFDTIFVISNFQLNVFYEDIQQKVYVILGIFMLFKLLFSFLSYLVNPDKINDKEQGMGKLITRVIVVFVMLLALPTAFDVLTELQNRLLPVVPRIIIGHNISSGEYFDDQAGKINVGGISNNMSLSIYRSFVRSSGSCSNEDGSASWENVVDARRDINKKCGDGEYVYEYIPVIPLLVAVAMLYVLISLNIDVAIRAFQILILKSMSPIPIISYVDPKSSKDGMFSKWTKMLLTTWGRLFINLGLVYFVVYLISMIFTGEFWAQTIGSVSSSGDPIVTTLVLVFIIVGLLFFARQAPKFVLDALGIKSQGNFLRMLGMGATALGGIGAARSAYKARNEYDKDNNLGSHRLRNLGASLFSGLGAVEKGGHAVMSTDKPTLATGFDALAKNNATTLSRISSGSTLGGRISALGQSLILGETDADILERKIKGLKTRQSALEAVKSRVASEMVKQDWTLGSISVKDANGNTKYLMQDVFGADVTGGINYKDFMARYDAAVSRGDGSVNIMTTNGMVEISMENANKYKGLLQKKNEEDYYTQLLNGKAGTMAANGEEIKEDKLFMQKVATANLTDQSKPITGRSSVNDGIEEIAANISQMEQENARNIANRRGQGNNGK